MAKNLTTLYPGKTDVDGNNPNGTFKNRTSDALKDGTPYEKGWASDIWGFVSHILGLAGISPNGAEENETNSQYYDALESLVGRRDVNFETEDLIINVQSNTTVDADAKRISLLDSNYIPKYINNLDLTFTMPTDLEAGTSEKASHWYGMWVDSDLNQRLVPDLTGSTDSTVAGFLADSTATLLTDLVHVGDIVYNLTDLTKTTVSADAVVEGQVALTDDIFTSGEDYKIVKMSPEGLGANRERIGAAYNNSGSNFDNSTYTQIQEDKNYSEAAGDFTVTGTNWTTDDAVTIPYQVNDWTGKSTWHLRANISGTYSVPTAQSAIAISGVIYKTGAEQAGSLNQSDNTVAIHRCRFPGGSNTTFFTVSATTTGFDFSFDVELDSKPTFHN